MKVFIEEERREERTCRVLFVEEALRSLRDGISARINAVSAGQEVVAPDEQEWLEKCMRVTTRSGAGAQEGEVSPEMREGADPATPGSGGGGSSPENTRGESGSPDEDDSDDEIVEVNPTGTPRHGQ